MLKNITMTDTKPTPEGGSTSTTFIGRRDFGKAHLEIVPYGPATNPRLQVLLRVMPAAAVGSPDVLHKEDFRRSPFIERTAADRRQGSQDADLAIRVTLRRKVKVPADEAKASGQRAGSERFCSYTDALRQLAAQISFPIIADYDPGFINYRTRLLPRTLNQNGALDLKRDLVNVPLWQALNVIAEVWDVSWRKKDGWIELPSPRIPYIELDNLDLSPPWSPAREG